MMQIPSVAPIVLDGKAISLALISTGLFIWTAINNYTMSKDIKAYGKNNDETLKIVESYKVGLEDNKNELKKIADTVGQNVELARNLQAWQKQAFKEMKDIAKFTQENHSSLEYLPKVITEISHQMEMVAQNQVIATNGLQQVINRMLDILSDNSDHKE